MTQNPFLTSIDEIADRFQLILQRSLLTLAVITACVIYTIYRETSAAILFSALLLVGLSFLPAYLFAKRLVHGLPIVPAMALFEMLWFAFPLISNHHSLAEYQEQDILIAAWSQILFLSILIFVWYRITRNPPNLKNQKLFIIPGNLLEVRTMANIWIVIMGLAIIYPVSMPAGWLNPILSYIPSGGLSIIRGVSSAACTLAIFFLALAFGRGSLNPFQSVLLWLFSILFFGASWSGVLLSSGFPVLLAGLAGYTLGCGKIPWRFMLALAIFVNILHLGKLDMRMKYWPEFLGMRVAVSPFDYPAYYGEWITYGLEELAAPEQPQGIITEEEEDDSILVRASLIQMLLYTQTRSPEHVPYLNGQTIFLIPKLLIPRVLWPDKPRTHEGQVILSIHYGRQDYLATLTTYIEWGMLTEAYANYGYTGIILLGVSLGLLFGYITRLTVGAPITSLRFLVGVIFMVNGITATQDSISIWTTSTFQAVSVVLLISMILMQRLSIAEIESLKKDHRTAAGKADAPRRIEHFRAAQT